MKLLEIFIKRGKKKGFNAFNGDPVEFSKKLIDERINQFNSSSKIIYSKEKPYVFFDRGIHDTFAYLNFLNKNYYYRNIIFSFSYDFVFFLKPWKKIYKNDAERMESFSDSRKLFNYIKLIYSEAKIKSKIILNDSVKNRVNYIINYLNNI